MTFGRVGDMECASCDPKLRGHVHERVLEMAGGTAKACIRYLTVILKVRGGVCSVYVLDSVISLYLDKLLQVGCMMWM